jgi:hypothetical protein
VVEDDAAFTVKEILCSLYCGEVAFCSFKDFCWWIKGLFVLDRDIPSIKPAKE